MFVNDGLTKYFTSILLMKSLPVVCFMFFIIVVDTFQFILIFIFKNFR